MEALPFVLNPTSLAKAKAVPLNGLQKSLLYMTKQLPQDADNLDEHMEALRVAAVSMGKFRTMADSVEGDITKAVAEARSKLGALFGSLT